MTGVSNINPSLNFFSSLALKSISCVTMFFLLFPRSFLESVILKRKNECLKENNKEPISLGDFIRWVGLLLLLSTVVGYQRLEFWSLKEIDRN